MRYVPQIFFICALFVISYGFRAPARLIKYGALLERQSKLQVIQPQDALDLSAMGSSEYVNEMAKQAADSFVYGFQSRIIATIFGNILAGVAFKIVADWASNAWNKSQEKKTTSDEPIEASIVSLEKNPKISTVSPSIPPQAWLKLLACVILDAISDSSFALPGVGELEDVVWAPLSALVLRSLFQSDTVAYAEFVKEILPFTDIIPFATTMWFLENVFVDSPLVALLKIKTLKDKLK